MATKLTPSHITIFFKHHKSTVALSLLPDTPLLTAKQQLLSTLASRNITTFPGTSTPLPSKADDLEFAILNDKRDPQSGWVQAEDRARLPRKKDRRPMDGEVESIGEWELRDGGYVAYRLRIEVDEAVEVESAWDVVVPAYEEEVEGEDIEVPRPRNQVAR